MNKLATFDPDAYAASFRRDGYFVHENVLSIDYVDRLRAAVAALPEREEVRRKRSVYGVRNLLEISPDARLLASQPWLRRFVTPLLGEDAFAVRAIFFNKTPDANWSLFWHQDNAIAVKEKREAAGFVGWSQKAGVWQVEPPANVLAKMVAIRVHLDDCGADNGPLRVLPGSHRHGWIEEQLGHWKSTVPEVICTVGRGGVVSMCPLTLHASARCEVAGDRRVIHIEYAADELPADLEWNTRVGPSATAAMDASQAGDGQATPGV